MAHVANTTCCGMREISNLSGNDTPEKALLDAIYRCQSGYTPTEYQNPFKTIMIFTGVVEIKGLETLSEVGRKQELDYASFAKDRNLTYAPKFAAFLRANKLGDVKRVVETFNEPGHPKHLVRLYVWTPDMKAVEAWWKAQLKKFGGIKKVATFIKPDNA